MAIKTGKTKDGVFASSSDLRLRAFKSSGGWRIEADAKRDGKFMRTAALPHGENCAAADLCDGKQLFRFVVDDVRASSSRGAASLSITASCGLHKLSQTMTVSDGSRAIHVHSEFSFAGKQKIASLGVPILFMPEGAPRTGRPDFAWVPTLRKHTSHVVADQIFRSPAAIVQSGSCFISLVPDLDVLSANRPLPSCLDLQIPEDSSSRPYVWYGFRTYKIDGHVFFKHAPEDAKLFRDEKLTLAFDLLLSADSPARASLSETSRFLWNRYGHELAAGLEPQSASFDVYSAHAANYAFDTGGIYHEFEIGGVTVAGTIASTFASKKQPRLLGESALKTSIAAGKLLPLLHGVTNNYVMTSPAAVDVAEFLIHNAQSSVPPLIMNQAWFCNMRTAYGLFSHGLRTGNFVYTARASRMKELLLSAPVQDGLWPSIVYFAGGKPLWFEGSRAFESVHDYHLPDAAWTGIWMLNWHRDLERDARLLERAAGLGDFLLKAQLPSGAIPSWVVLRRGGFRSRNTLRESAQTAASAMFLASLAVETGDIKYATAARRAADFIIDNIIPSAKWWDFETFFSCSKKDRNMRDAGSGIVCMNNLCIFWTAELMLSLYDITCENRYLDAGVHAADLLTMWQQVWDAPFISINTFGGFGVMNTDAEWNDARQSMFAECLAGYYSATGNIDYFERAIAALRASFTLMLCPENATVAPGNLGMLREKDYGAIYENYAHHGFDKRVPGYVMFDWGGGGALAAAARLRLLYGDIFIRSAAGEATGVDFCTVNACSVTSSSVKLDVTFGGAELARKVIIKSDCMKGAMRELIVNGLRLGRFSSKSFNDGIEIITGGVR